jgi:hypothetical protein
MSEGRDANPCLRALEARGASRGNADPFPVEPPVFPHLTVRASQQRDRRCPPSDARGSCSCGHDAASAPGAAVSDRRCPRGATQTLASVPWKPEARAEGMRIRFPWSHPYSLTLRFGLPGSGDGVVRPAMHEVRARAGMMPRPLLERRGVFAPAHPCGPAPAYGRLGEAEPPAAAPRRPRSPGGATAPPSGEPSAFATTAQGCRGHGWPDSRKTRRRTAPPPASGRRADRGWE